MSTENGGPSFGDALVSALEEAVAHERGEAPAQVRRVEHTARHTRVLPPPAYKPEQIRAIRLRMSMSQAVFAEVLNASASAVRAWEQGVREPDGPTRRLLQVAELNPDALAYTVEGTPMYTPPRTPRLMVAERPLRTYGAPTPGETE